VVGDGVCLVVGGGVCRVGGGVGFCELQAAAASLSDP
jgi:hypothetical protein